MINVHLVTVASAQEEYFAFLQSHDAYSCVLILTYGTPIFLYEIYLRHSK